MRKLKPQLQRIDIDELFNNSSNRGMLSFLERPPEEAKVRLLEKQRVNEADSHRLLPVGELPPVGDSLPVGNLSVTDIESSVPFPSDLQVLPQYKFLSHEAKVNPVGDLPPDVSRAESESPVSVIYPQPSVISEAVCHTEHNQAIRHPEGKLPRGYIPARETLSIVSPAPEKGAHACYPEGKLPPPTLSSTIDGALVGRRQKIRRATVAQDGHSSGEQLLYQSLWNAASTETQETRLISVGYNGMSALCKLDKSNCKKNIQSLVEKLSVQVAETYQTANSIGTTYRIFSYREILRRREAAGMIWVIRTSGVRFVHPEGDLPTLAVGDSRPDPVGKTPIGPVGKIPTAPVGETHTPLGKEKNTEGTTTSAIVRTALSHYGLVDDDAVNRLIRNCQDQSADCTYDEIVYFVHEKGSLTKGKGTRIQNPIGFLIDAVPKCFAGDTIRLYRELRKQEPPPADEPSQEERDRAWGREHEGELNDPNVPDEIKRVIRRCLGLNDQP